MKLYAYKAEWYNATPSNDAKTYPKYIIVKEEKNDYGKSKCQVSISGRIVYSSIKDNINYRSNSWVFNKFRKVNINKLPVNIKLEILKNL